MAGDKSTLGPQMIPVTDEKWEILRAKRLGRDAGTRGDGPHENPYSPNVDIGNPLSSAWELGRSIGIEVYQAGHPDFQDAESQVPKWAKSVRGIAGTGDDRLCRIAHWHDMDFTIQSEVISKHKFIVNCISQIKIMVHECAINNDEWAYAAETWANIVLGDRAESIRTQMFAEHHAKALMCRRYESKFGKWAYNLQSSLVMACIGQEAWNKMTTVERNETESVLGQRIAGPPLLATIMVNASDAYDRIVDMKAAVAQHEQTYGKDSFADSDRCRGANPVPGHAERAREKIRSCMISALSS